MSDPTREALARMLADSLVKQQGEQDWTPPTGDSVCLDGFFAQDALADAILAEFLVFPRSEIVGTEYGWRYANPGEKPFTWRCDRREDAVETAADVRRLQRRKGHEENAEAVQRPLPSWSPIPLPEDGESQ